MDLSNFYSDSVSTPPWLHFRISSFIGVGHSILNCCVNFFLSREIKFFSLFGTFWRFDVVLNKVERKVSQSATLELAQEDPIRFQVGRLNHTAIAALRSYYFYLSVIVELLCGFYSLKVSRKYHFLAASDRFIKKTSLDRKYPQWARLELELDGPIEFLFRLRQHSATTAFQNLWFYRCRSSDPELLCDFLPLSREIDYFSLLRTFWRLDVVLNKGERKMSHSARFELALEDPIWFLVRRLNHSAMTAWSRFYFILSVNVELLCGFYFFNVLRKYRFWQVPIGS